MVGKYAISRNTGRTSSFPGGCRENEEGGKMIGYFRKRKRVAWIVTLLLSVTILFGMSGTTVSAATGAWQMM